MDPLKKYMLATENLFDPNVTIHNVAIETDCHALDFGKFLIVKDVDAMVDGHSHPAYSHITDAGMDLHAYLKDFKQIPINPGKSVIIDTGLHLDLPSNIVGLVFARSGLGSKGICLRNGVGVIDPGYHGSIKVPLWNTSDKTYFVDANERIAQIVFVPFISVHLNIVEKFAESERENGGFGSTGA